MSNYFTEYPTHIEVPEDYWIMTIYFDGEVEYCEKESKG